MKIKIEFETGNDAFDIDGSGELEYVMAQARQIIEKSNDSSKVFESGCKLRDINGNTIGRVQISE